jgi:hypothetical protein
MHILSAELARDRPSTSIVHRPFAGVGGFRRVTDRAARIAVEAFPITLVSELAGAGLLPPSGAYIICDDHCAYIGESTKLARRLAEHATDPTKAFARDVFVISAGDRSPFDKNLILDLQFRLTNRALDAAMVTVMRGVNPVAVDLEEADRATHDRLFDDALRLLHDAGAWFLHAYRSPPPPAPQPTPARDEASDAEDDGPMTIGVTTTPLGAEEFEMRYDDVWARGYWHAGHFIVAAGSEVRLTTNGSCNQITRARRNELFGSGALAPIPGVETRQRLITAVAFPSTSIAAKCCCGAHTTPRWSPITRSRVMVLDRLRQAESEKTAL